MSRPRRFVVSFAALAISLPLGIAGSAHAGSGVTRYASPNGTGTACAQAHPCSIVTAINHASAGAEVILARGNYGSHQHPITAPLVAEGVIDIHGPVGGSRPVISTSADTGIDLGGSTLEYVRIASTGSNSAVFSLNGTVSHVIAATSAPGAAACAVFRTLIDSLCLATGVEAVAVATESGSGGPAINKINVVMSNVTAEATDPTGIGLLADANSFTTIKVRATNDIIHGGQVDVSAHTDTATSTTTISLSHCDFRTHQSGGATGSHTVTSNPANTVPARPRFVDPAHLKYEEKPTSPTIDKGAAVPAADTDIVHRPRTIGRAPDIGAYEFLQRPVVHVAHKHSVTSSSAAFIASVNAEGLVAKVRLVATHGHTHVQSPWLDAKNKRVPLRIGLTIHGLAARTKYAVRVLANNAGGTTKSAAVSITTE